MDMSYAHFWGQFGLPLNLPFKSKTGGGYYYIDENLKIPLQMQKTRRLLKERIPHVKIIPTAHERYVDLEIKLDYDINFEELGRSIENLPVVEADSKITNDLESLKKLDKKYKHFIKKIPGENDETFEDYKRQLRNTMIAGVLYPFEFIPFYHYEPRRHNKDRIAEVLQDIKDNHIFLEAERTVYKESLSIRLKEKNILPELENALKSNNKDNDFVKKLLLPKTNEFSCFGIKMYPKLGYAPYDYERYPQLRDFYAFCAAQKIPITTHCSAGGMTIADSRTYLKEALKEKNDAKDLVIRMAAESKERWNFANKSYDNLKDSHRFINETCCHPKAWEKVLNDYELKLCLAHFGGNESWYEERKDIAEYWVDEIISIIEKNEDVYTDISYFVNRWWNIKKTAEKLSEKINAHKAKLQKRILMGSDWYMIEREAAYNPGVDTYYRRMFEVLKLVSEKVGFDAWYYFAVENPLRYLGFIEDGGDKICDCAKGMEKLKAHKEYVSKKIGLKGDKNDEDVKDFLKDSNIKNINLIEEKMDMFLGSDEKKKYPNHTNPIKFGGFVNLMDLKEIRDMKDKNGELLILSKEEN